MGVGERGRAAYKSVCSPKDGGLFLVFFYKMFPKWSTKWRESGGGGEGAATG